MASALLNKWKETLHGVMYIQIQQLYVIEFLSSLYLVDFLWSENLMKHQLDFTLGMSLGRGPARPGLARAF